MTAHAFRFEEDSPVLFAFALESRMPLVRVDLLEGKIDGRYLGIQRSSECVPVRVTLNAGRSTEMKKDFYRAVAHGLHARPPCARQRCWSTLVEAAKETGSFGNGETQYADRRPEAAMRRHGGHRMR